MTANEWLVLAGILVSVLLTVGPPLISLHAKLAVVATQVAGLCEKVDRLFTSHDERLRMCIEHQSRLETHEVQIAELHARLRQTKDG